MSATPLEEWVAAPERPQTKEAIQRVIREAGVQYVYCQHVSISGRVLGKGVPAPHFGEVCDRGYQLVYGSVADLQIDRAGNFIGFEAHESELVGIPDLETFRILPWEPRIARVFADCFDTETGDHFEGDSRWNLKRIAAEVEAELGGRFMVGIEPEMMWLKRDRDRRLTGVTQPSCYHITQLEQLRSVLLDVLSYSQQMGLDMIQGDHEDAPGQLELNIRHDRAPVTADNITTYRQVCGEVARKHDLIACFMPKPFDSVTGNGHHHHMSMVTEDGVDLFHDPHGPAQLSELGLRFLAGIIEHADALCALAAPTVNSYKRFWDSGRWAPLYKGWGWQNRTSLVRVAAPGRLEYRVPDAAVNPYLSLAGILVAGRDGVRSRLDPGPPQEGNAYEEGGPEKPLDDDHGGRVPLNLGEALKALQSDPVVQEALPGRMYRVFFHYKTDEWQRYLAHVSDWEIDRYLDSIP